jgi:septal ring factor EnvC (AmiA/AmiB activator)
MLVYLDIGKIFQYLFVHQKDNSQKPPAKVKRNREEMQATLENRKKVVAEFPKSALKRKNKVEEGGVLGSRVKREHESIEIRAQKVMRGRMAPFEMPTLV